MKPLLRRIWWILLGPRVRENLSSMGLVGYPMVIWLELGGGREYYFEHGSEAFTNEVERVAKEKFEDLVDACCPDHLKRIEKRWGSITCTIARLRAIRAQKQEEHRAKLAMIAELDRLVPE